MAMNPEIKAQWVADLRSGEFRQGQNYLNVDGKLCCLGVLCEQAAKAGVTIAGPESGDEGVILYGGIAEYPSVAVVEWAGLDNSNPRVSMGNGRTADLASLNDGDDGCERHTFGQIADIIEAQL